MTPVFRNIVRLVIASASIWFFTAGIAAAQGADLEVTKWTFADPAAANATVSYFIEVFNNGPDNAQNVVVTDVLPPDTTFQLADAFPPDVCSFNAGTRTVTCTVAELVAYDAAFFQIDIQAPPYAGSITNTATVTSSTTDSNPDNNSSSVTTPVVVFNLSDLAVTTTASASSVLVHRAVTFTTTVTNLGPHDAAGVDLLITPPFLADIISLTSSQGRCTTTALGDLDCVLGPLATGASATVTLAVKPQKDGFAQVFAFASGYGDPGFLDPNSSNDFAAVTIDVNYPGNAHPAYSKTTSRTVPYSTLIYNPCTEDILSLDGTVRQVVSITESPAHFGTNAYINYSGLTGTGLLSGTTYRVLGNSRTGSGLNLNFGGWWPSQLTIQDNLKLIGDDGSTLQLHQNTHFTVNVDGTYTAVVDNPILVCR